MDKPFSQACENNKRPILEVLQRVFVSPTKVLEIGSGTGQHAVFFAKALSHLVWQPTDLQVQLAGIAEWINAEPQPNLLSPLALDIRGPEWPITDFDAVFSANTAHIMAWDLTQKMIRQCGAKLPQGGIFALYGPFNYQGRYTSDSNARFDQWLKSTATTQGIRNFEDVVKVASEAGLLLLEDNAMPANNRLLVWKKSQ